LFNCVDSDSLYMETILPYVSNTSGYVLYVASNAYAKHPKPQKNFNEGQYQFASSVSPI